MRRSDLKLVSVIACSLLANQLSAQEPKLRTTLKGHKGTVTSLAFNPDGETLVSGSTDQSIKKWWLATGKNYTKKNALKDACWSVAFSPNGRALFLGGSFHTIKMYDRDFLINVTYEDREQCARPILAVSPNGMLLASGAFFMGKVQLWDVNIETTSLARSKAFEGDLIHALAFTPDSKILAYLSGSYGLVLRDVATGTNLCEALKPDDRKHVENLIARLGDQDPLERDKATKELKSFGRSSLALLRKAQSDENEEIATRAEKIVEFLGKTGPGAAYCAAFTSDCKTLATAGNYIKLWEVSTGKEKATLQGLAPSSVVTVFSPDGKTLAVGCETGSIRLWNVTTGKEFAMLDGHKGFVWSLAFSHDGKTLASGGEDGTIKLWDLEPRK